MSVTAKALWYIESHLVDDDLSLDAIAESAGVSRFHLSRAFAAALGVPLATYARARRLSEAAKLLAGGASDILDVALTAGYGSHEAFTRAFRQHFDVTPEQFRLHPNQPLQEPLRMNPTHANTLTAPRIEKHEAILLFGLSMHCKMTGDPGIPTLWNKFTPYIGNIEAKVSNATYGACYNSDDAGNYEYLCAIEVRNFPAEPKEFTRLRVPEQTYAVFEHQGHISGIAGTFRAIWEHGLSDAGVKASDGPLFERYDENFNGMTGQGGLEIWIPIRV
ncbi:MAG: AraC family transcriptional regulator [Bryobacteraceae bacterium]